MIVMKFGGSSIKDEQAFNRVVRIIEQQNENEILVVLSAIGGVTNDLIAAIDSAAHQGQKNHENILQKIFLRHQRLASETVKDKSLQQEYLLLLKREIEKTRILLNATETIHAESRRISDGVLSCGEILSSHLLQTILTDRGASIKLIDARKLITVRHHKNDSIPQTEAIRTACRREIPPLFKSVKIVVTQGFIALTPQGAPATLGRDGSDLTAALIGAALQAAEIQIWSDVDGILTADPSILPQARPIDSMSFEEASELAYFGARVLHPATIQPAVKAGIPVRVLNSHKPHHCGTLILTNNEANGSERVVKSIAYKENITLITIESSHLLLSPAMMEDIFSLLNKHGKKVYAVSKSATKISLTLENYDDAHALRKAFEDFGQVIIASGKVLVSIVGEEMQKAADLQWRILQLLEKNSIRLELVSQFANHISLVFIVDEHDIAKTVRLLHRELIENELKMSPPA